MERERRKFEMILAFAILFAMVFVSIGCASAATIYVPTNYSTIQEAIDNAIAGDTIIVNASGGPYYENVVVNKQLSLIGINMPTVNVSGSGSAISLIADGITLEGFTTTNSGSSGRDAGIKVTSNNNIITGNNASSNDGSGIGLSDSNNNTITSNNVCNNNDNGIDLHGSRHNTITGNIASKNTFYGIDLSFGSNNNTITGNIASSNNYNGICIEYSSNYNNITGNNASSNGYDGIDLHGSRHNTITGNIASKNTFYGIDLSFGSNNNTITGNTVSNNWDGIDFSFGSNNNTITGNTASKNTFYGIDLSFGSNNNTITGNTVSNNDNGIYFSSSSNNLIYNNYFNNTNNGYDDGNNTWNITKTEGTNIIGGAYLGGNYWSDYAGEDSDGDGLGDTMLPYNSSGNIINGGDWLPLTMLALRPPPTPTPTPTPTPKILFSDDFSDEDSGWVTYDEYDGRVIYEDGCLYVTDYTNLEFAMYGESQRYFTDFIIEVETRLVGGTDDNWHLVGCRFKDEGNTYWFGISADGYYTINKEVNGKVEVLVAPTRSVYIHQGRDVTNLIHVECIGSSLSLSVNG